MFVLWDGNMTEGPLVSRKTFLTLAAGIALGVGAFAIMFPAEFLASKGTLPSGAANLWMRETGVLLVCMGIIVLVRAKPARFAGRESADAWKSAGSTGAARRPN